MLQDDDKARLSVILTAIVRVTEAKHALTKASIAFMESVKGGQPLDAAAALALLDEAVQKCADAADEAKVFRNIVKNERSPSIRNAARSYARNPDHYRNVWGRDLPRHQRDPQDIINRTLGRPRT
jgi:hypothetical protein